jgi:hypothetical protein
MLVRERGRINSHINPEYVELLYTQISGPTYTASVTKNIKVYSLYYKRVDISSLIIQMSS